MKTLRKEVDLIVPCTSLVWASCRDGDLIGMGGWKTGMTKSATSRKIFALMSPLRARRGLVGVISIIAISLVVTEDTTLWTVANTSSSYTGHQHIRVDGFCV